MTEMVNDTFLRALHRQPVDYTPIWIMRQAGRYLPEYWDVRNQARNFLNLCKTPELACEATLQPLRRFPLDAGIIFSDILTIPDAMGLELSFVHGEGPKFAKTIDRLEDVTKLSHPDPETELRYVMDAIRLVKQELQNKLPLIGFSGSPWTLAAYMVEGSGSKTFSKVRGMIYSAPEVLHGLLQVLADAVSLYLQGQIKAGVDCVMIFDTWGGLLTTPGYQDFSLDYMEKIISQIRNTPEGKKIPIILFTKNGGQWLQLQAESGCDAIGLDWTTSIGAARQQVGSKVVLQGNMDPATLYGSPERIKEEVQRILGDYGPGEGHVFNLGHGINPDVPVEHVAALVEAVHGLSGAYHQ